MGFRRLFVEQLENRRVLAVSILLDGNSVPENGTGAVIGAVTVDGVSPSATKVTVNYDARIATVSGTPFGYSSTEAREQQVLGSFTYDLTTADTNGTSSRGYYPHVTGGGEFSASFLSTVLTGSATPFVEIEDFSGGVSDTFRFIDGPRTIGNEGGVMSVNGIPNDQIELWMALVDGSGSAFTSDSLPNPLPFAVPPLSEPSPFFFPHTFSIKDGANGTLLLQLNEISMAADYTLSVSDQRFEIVDGQLKLKDGVGLNFEAEPMVALDIVATDGEGLETTNSFLIQVANVNEPPSGVNLSRLGVFAEIAGAWVATVSASDPDATDSLTFAVSDSRFEVIDRQLFLKDGQTVDLATESSIALVITATDGGGLIAHDSFVLPVQLPPSPWDFAHQWAPQPFDVNVDGIVSPLDAALIINEINASGSRVLTPANSGTLPPLFFDASGDGSLGPADPLLVINYLNASGNGFSGEMAEPEPTVNSKSANDHALLAWLAWQELLRERPSVDRNASESDSVAADG